MLSVDVDLIEKVGRQALNALPASAESLVKIW